MTNDFQLVKWTGVKLEMPTNRCDFKSAKAFDESNMKWGVAKKSSVPDLFLGNLVSYATKIIISRKEIDLQKK